MTKSKYEMKTYELLQDFDEAAKHWGYIEDQGTGSEVGSAKEAYSAARKTLADRIDRLHALKRRCERLEEGIAALQAKLAAREGN